MGLLEFLEWCEDLKMQPLLAVYAGYSMRQPHVAPGADLEPYVQDALDEIEYVTGDVSTKWGAQRAKDGHPAPFPLNYIEVGNEDNFDRTGSYDARYTQFYDAIKAKHPNLQIIATTRVTTRTPDLTDEHLYPNSEGAMEARAHELTITSAPARKFRRRMGHARRRPDAEHGGRARRRRVDDRHGTQFGHRADGQLRAVVRQREPAQPRRRRLDAMADGFDRLRRAHQLRFAVVLRATMFSTHHGDVILAMNATDIPTKAGPAPARRGGATNQPAATTPQLPRFFPASPATAPAERFM